MADVGGTTDDLALGTGADGRFSLVVFFRGLHCPVCRKQAGELDRRLAELREAGVGRVLAVSMETPERSAQLAQEWHLGDLPVGVWPQRRRPRASGDCSSPPPSQTVRRRCSMSPASSSSTPTGLCTRGAA